MYLSIIIPAYNEKNRIIKTLRDFDFYFKNKDYEYEIVVVNDGSKDETAEIVSKMRKEIKNLVLIDNKKNNGKGFVVRQGLLSAKGDWRLFADADNSTPIEEIEKFIPFLKNNHIIIGSRAIKGSLIKNPQPFSRRFVGKVFNLMVQFLIGLWGVWDTQCGFKVLSKQAAENILPLCKINRWAFDPEILIIGKKLGYGIKEIPVVWINDIESKVKKSAMFKMGLDLILIRWNLITNKYGRKQKTSFGA